MCTYVQDASVPTRLSAPSNSMNKSDKLRLVFFVFSPHNCQNHRTLGFPTVHRPPPHPWLSLRESWREAPERAHRTDSTNKPPTDPPHRSPIRNRIPPRTACTSLSPSLREVPLPMGRGKARVQTSSITTNRIFSHRPKVWQKLRLPCVKG